MTPIDTQLTNIDPLDSLVDDAPPELLPDTYAARLYYMLTPLARADPDNAWSLLIYMNATGVMFQLVEDLVRDTPDGPGWSILLDLDRCIPEALPWLGQLVGVRLPAGMNEADQRERIAQTDGFKRGTRSALIGALQATLTGTKTVIMRERDHDPADTPNYAYYLSVYTYDDETPRDVIGTSTLPVTSSGNELTDATRTANIQGDGLPLGSGTGIWEATTNQVTNSGAETTASAGGAQGVGSAAVTRDTTTFKFGAASFKVVT